MTEITDAGGTTVEADYSYDPLGRLYEVSVVGGAGRRYLWDGDAIIGEYDATGALTQRYVHLPGSLGAPVVLYECSGVTVTDRRFLQTDERGSVIAITHAQTGAQTAANTDSAYGEPGDGNAGPFGYTGQLGLPEAGLWYMRNRVYEPTLGRFMQTDPIGYQGGMNLYAYVGGDPVNGVDPLGLRLTTCSDGTPGCHVATANYQRTFDQISQILNDIRELGGGSFLPPIIIVTACDGPDAENAAGCKDGRPLISSRDALQFLACSIPAAGVEISGSLSGGPATGGHSVSRQRDGSGATYRTYTFAIGGTDPPRPGTFRGGWSTKFLWIF